MKMAAEEAAAVAIEASKRTLTLFSFNKIEVKRANKLADILPGDNHGQLLGITLRPVAILIDKKKKRSNVAIVISSKCTTGVLDLRQHYPVETHVLRK